MPAKKTKPGRPAFVITKAILEEVEKLAFLLLNQSQIADCLGIRLETLCRKKKQHDQFNQAIKRGRARGLAELAKDLRQHQKNTPAAAIFKAKVHLKWKENEPEDPDIPEIIVE